MEQEQTTLLKDYSLEEKGAYFGALATIASADGNASDEELEFLRLMAEAAELPENLQQDLYFICTGTGIAPFRSMLHYIDQHNLPHQNIYLIFGTRTKSDLLYYEEMTRLAQNIPQFHYLPTLSREQWEGCCGYVHTVYEQLVLQNKNGGELPPASFYLCGWKNMVDEAKANILKLGYDKKAIHLELYG